MRETAHYRITKFRSAVRHFFMGRTIQGVASLLVTLWLIRLLSAQDYGEYMTILGLVETAVPLTSLGILEATRRFLPELVQKGGKNNILEFIVSAFLVRVFIIIVCVLIIIFYWVEITGWLGFEKTGAKILLITVSFMVVVVLFRYVAEMLECLLEQRFSQLARAILPVGQLIGIGALIIFKGSISLEQILALSLGVAFVCLFLSVTLLLRQVCRLPDGSFKGVPLKTIISFAWHMAGANVVQLVSGFGVLRMIVANRLGQEIAGEFAFLQQLMQIVERYLPANLFSNLIRPMFISQYTISRKLVVINSGLNLMWKSNLIIISVITIGLIAYGDQIVAVISGGRINKGGTILALMFIGLIASSQRQMLEMAMQILKRTKELRILAMVTTVLPITVWYASEHGLFGVSCGLIAGSVIWNCFAYGWMIHWQERIEFDWSGALRICGSTVMISMVILYLEQSSIVIFGISILSYVFLLLFMTPFTSSEIGLIEKVFKT